MSRIHKFTFNPFMENTYIVSDETKQCVIIDPGCSNDRERTELAEEIEVQGLEPVRLLNTHCHIDHIPGNKFIHDRYGLLPEIHEAELSWLRSATEYGKMFGFPLEASPLPKVFLNEGDIISFGNTTFSILFTPGHSPGSISFYNENEGYVLSGDVLFYGSIGRYDLPGSDGNTLYDSLTRKMMALPDQVKVYSGHGPETTIGHERSNNPFILQGFLA